MPFEAAELTGSGVAADRSAHQDAARAHWERVFARGETDDYSRVEVPAAPSEEVAAALQLFGDVAGKRVLDLGCGSGKASLSFASRGALVTSIDTSVTAIANLQRFCRERHVVNLDARVLSAMDMSGLGGFDFIYGSMVLHHVEPFERFAEVLRNTLAPAGRAFFYENHLALPGMSWFRQHCVGRFGIPKYGDADESPLTPDEVDRLRRYFRVDVEYPELLLMRLFSIYLLNRRFHDAFGQFDAWLYRIPALRPLSYRQYIKLTAASSAM